MEHNGTAERLKLMLEALVRELVDDSDQVEVKSMVAQRTIVLTVYTAREDTGKVIGRKGNTARLIRSLLGSIGAKHRLEIMMEIDEEVRR